MFAKQKVKRDSVSRRGRNSAIEALRLFAMFLIVLNHFPWPGELYSWNKPLTTWILLYAVNLGGVGDCLFFGITAWFLCNEEFDFRKNCGRVWQLEKQLLYYSILIFVFFAGLQIYEGKTAIKSVVWPFFLSLLPVTRCHWWYPTAYVMFLFIIPFLSIALKSLGKKLHGSLVLILLVFFGLISFSQNTVTYGMSYSVFLFVYQYILLSYVRWYLPDALKSRRLALVVLLVGIGLCVITQQFTATSMRHKHIYWTGWDSYMNCPACIPSLFIALALLMFATQVKKHVFGLVNLLSSSTLSVYLLITDYRVSNICQKVVGKFSGLGTYRLFMACFLMAAIFFVVSLAFDLVRHFLFRYIFNRQPNKYFNVLWRYFVKASQSISEKYDLSLSRFA